METNNAITIEQVIDAPVEKVWKSWTTPEDIMQWCNASEDWCVPAASNDLRTGGRFTTRMESKDGKYGFDFGGTYTELKNHELIAYTMDDNRKVSIRFAAEGDATRITETFDAESTNPVEMQRTGWQSILDNFKRYTESK